MHPFPLCVGLLSVEHVHLGAVPGAVEAVLGALGTAHTHEGKTTHRQKIMASLVVAGRAAVAGWACQPKAQESANSVHGIHVEMFDSFI